MAMKNMRFVKRTWAVVGLIVICLIAIVVIVILRFLGTHKVPLETIVSSSGASSIKTVAVNGDSVIKNGQVTTSCYTYDLPINYSLTTVDDSAEPNNCDSSTNPSDEPGALNYIDVSPKTIKVGTDPVATLKQVLTRSGTTYGQVSTITVDGLQGAQALVPNDNNGTFDDGESETYVIVPAPGPNAWTESGQTIYSYLITAYTYNSSLQNAFNSVINSIKLKSPA